MSIPASCTIHPSAVIDPGAVLGENVRVGAFTLIGARMGTIAASEPVERRASA